MTKYYLQILLLRQRQSGFDKPISAMVVFVLALMLLLYSCSTNTFHRVQSYTLVRTDTCSHIVIRGRNTNTNSIILISDTTLKYSIFFGGLGVSTAIGYNLSDNMLIVDSFDIYKRGDFHEITNDDIFGHRFYYSKDSLLDINRNDFYYSRKLIQKKLKSSKNTDIFFIVNNNKHKLNYFNRKRISKLVDSEKDTIIKVCVREAKEKYGIDDNDFTFEILRKSP